MIGPLRIPGAAGHTSDLGLLLAALLGGSATPAQAQFQTMGKDC